MQLETQLAPSLHWDLSNVYASLSSDDYTESIARLTLLIDDLDSYIEEQNIAASGESPGNSSTLNASPLASSALAGIINGYLERINVLLRLYGTLEAYVYSFVTTDSYNTKAKRAASELEMLGVRLEQQEVRFRGWLGAAARIPDMLHGAIELGGPAAAHAFYLQEEVRQSHYLMSQAEESLASELSLSGANAWSRLQGVIISQAKAPFEQDGKIEELPISVIQNYYNDPNEELRRRAYEAELQILQSQREPLAACLNGVKGAVLTLDKRRGRTDPLQRTLEQARIDRQTLEAMLQAMRDSFPVFRRYWQAKARRLNKEFLPWWDLQAPVGRLKSRFTFKEAKEMILDQFNTFSEPMVGFSRRAFEDNWIDAEPRDGKVAGGFCMSVPEVEESRILVNFDGTLSAVMVLAHELGHAYHNKCHNGKTMLQRQTPMTLAETASIFNQTIVTEAVLSEAADIDEELAILEIFLIDTSQVIVDIYSRYLFETEVFERRVEAELSADEFCEIMVRCQQATYANGLDERYLHPYMWTWKGHYYIPDLSFYNFPYAFGQLFSMGLFQIYQEEDSGFLKAYDKLLRNSGEGTAAELASRFGIDLHEPAFWENGLKIIEKRIERYLEI
jgi:pepF/M3 family oligoendopeptidase